MNNHRDSKFKSVLYKSINQLHEFYLDDGFDILGYYDSLLEYLKIVDASIFSMLSIEEEKAISDVREKIKSNRQELDGNKLFLVPYGLKDNISTKGTITTFGSRLLKDNIPSESSPVYQKLVDSGGILLGKTNMSEMGFNASTKNLLNTETKNPWDLSKSAGGSSGGSAAIVAAGICPYAIGTDGGGSIRIPASFCGVFGFKPSFGRVPHYPNVPWKYFSTVGIISRKVDDTVTVFSKINFTDYRDRSSFLSEKLRAIIDTGNMNFRNLRIAWSEDFGYGHVDSNILDVCQEAISILRKNGISIEEKRINIEDPFILFQNILAAGQRSYYGTKDLSRLKSDIEPARYSILLSADKLTGRDIMESYYKLTDWRVRFLNNIIDFDILLTPTVGISAFANTQNLTISNNNQIENSFKWSPFSYPFNITGGPASSIPCGFTQENLPVGMQVASPNNDDYLVLAFSKFCEDVFRWPDVHPPQIGVADEI